MRKPQDLPMKIFTTWMTELKNYVTLFPISSVSKKMSPEELNDILLHTVPNVWAKQANLQGMCKHMEITEKVYGGGNTSKNTNRVEADCSIYGNKLQVG